MLSVVRFGPFELQPDQRVLLAHGEPQRLGGRAYDILLALVERRDRVVEFDELLDVVWPGLAVEENNLSVQISGLRKLLGADAITTVRGKGYRFTAAVDEDMPQAEKDQGAAPLINTLPSLATARRWADEGALVALEIGGTGTPGITGDPLPAIDVVTQSAWREALGGRVLVDDERGLVAAFDRAYDAARAALRVQRLAGQNPQAPAGGHAASARLALIAFDPNSAADFGASVALARVLAAGTDALAIVTTAELVTEFIAGVDADIEDLGDRRMADGTLLRCHRLLPPQPVAAPHIALSPLRPAIAVLPFEGLMAPQADELLGEALADEVIAALCQCAELSVVSGLSSRRLRRSGLQSEPMANVLGARFLLTGTWRPQRSGLLLNLRLQDARQAAVLCAMQIETTLQRAFDPAEALGAQVAQQIAHTLFSHAVVEARAHALPELESHVLLMAAIGLMHRTSMHEFEHARTLLDHLARRPGCAAAASTWLAKWHVLRNAQGWSLDPTADAERALVAVQRSLDHDSHDALALAIGGLVHAYLRKDLKTAGRFYDDAICANPSEPLAWLFSGLRHAYLGRGAQALDASERALALSPLDPMKYFFDSLAAAAALAGAGWQHAEALCLRSLRANRIHAPTWRTLAFALVMQDRVYEARSAVDELRVIDPGYSVSKFRERFPGRDGPLAAPWAEALSAAGLPD